MSYQDIAKILQDQKEKQANEAKAESEALLTGEETSQETKEIEFTTEGDSKKNLEEAHEFVKKIIGLDEQYVLGTKATPIKNAIRVEQGEYITQPLSATSPPIGTHHISPCIAICAMSESHFGMAHFDSYRIPESLREFFESFQKDANTTIRLLGGEEGMDPLRTGSENREQILKYIAATLPDAKVTSESKPDAGFIECVFYPDGEIKKGQFAVGIQIHQEEAAKMRLIHSMGGLVSAFESRTKSFIPLNLVQAFDGSLKPVLIDRLEQRVLKEHNPGTDEEINLGWASDSGGTCLGKEMKEGFILITEEVQKERDWIDDQLSSVIENKGLREKCLQEIPLYIGPNAKEANHSIIEVITSIYHSTDSPDVFLSEIRRVFNEQSQYPMLRNLLPDLAQAMNISEEMLASNLKARFGELESLAYGVDVTSNDIVEVVKELTAVNKEALPLLDTLKKAETDLGEHSFGEIINKVCAGYGLNAQEVSHDITKQYNHRLTLATNKEKILGACVEKNDSVKNNILQILQNEYGARFPLIKKRLELLWNDERRQNPQEIFEIVIGQIPHPRANEELIEEFQRLNAVIATSHLSPVDSDSLMSSSMRLRENKVGSILFTILKDSALSVLNETPGVKEDMSQRCLDEGQLTKVIREKIPYQNPTNPFEDMVKYEPLPSP